MDAVMVDLGAATQAKAGDEVTLLGAYGDEKITAEELASLAQTIPYDIVTRLEAGIPRFYTALSRQPSAISQKTSAR
jgi:alanine racemase